MIGKWKMALPNLCVVDTNVPITANLATNPDPDSDVPDECVRACVEAIKHVTNNKALVIDNGDEIFDEYRKHLSLSGQPGQGDIFMKWVHDNRWNFPQNQRVEIVKQGNSYKEFPVQSGLEDFDLSDRKFVAVANAHPNKPPILQATDSKWLGWSDSLNNAGINVCFICLDHIESKLRDKMD